MLDYYKAQHFSHWISLCTSPSSPDFSYIMLTDRPGEWGQLEFVVEFYTKFIMDKKRILLSNSDSIYTKHIKQLQSVLRYFVKEIDMI
jgi:hypothetical protein